MLVASSSYSVGKASFAPFVASDRLIEFSSSVFPPAPSPWPPGHWPRHLQDTPRWSDTVREKGGRTEGGARDARRVSSWRSLMSSFIGNTPVKRKEDDM